MVQSLDKINIKYKIISVDESEQSILVRYWTDFLSEEELAIDDQKNEDGTPVRCRTDFNFNIWENVNTEEDLHNMISTHAPIDWFKLQYKVKNPNFDSSLPIVKNLLNKTHEKEIDLTVKIAEAEKELTDDEIDKLLEQLTAKQ